MNDMESVRLPHNLEAERALLGALILDNRFIPPAVARLPHLAVKQAVLLGLNKLGSASIESLFYSPAHQLIFAAIVTLHERFGSLDLTTLAAELERRGQLNAAGGAPYLAGLEDDVFSMGQVPQYVDIVAAKYQRRIFTKAAHKMFEDCLREDLPLADFVETQKARIEQLVENCNGQVHIPRVLSAKEFCEVERPPFEWHIQDLLPKQGKMTFSATSKFGKSLLALQIGYCLAAGDCEFLGWRFGHPVKVIYFQGEISDALLAERLEWINRHWPEEIDYQRAHDNLIIQEVSESRPMLATPEGRRMIEKLIERESAQAAIFDPLVALWPGLDEDKASAMRPALETLTDITLNQGCAVILVHHHGKAGTTRGSSDFPAWGDADISATYLDEEDHSTAKFTFQLRAAWNQGPQYVQMPGIGSPWFSSMPEGWTPAPKGRPKAVPDSALSVLLRGKGHVAFTALRKSIMDAFNCSESSAKRSITKSLSLGQIKVDPEGLYYVGS